MNDRYQVNEDVLYGVNGVCRVMEIAQRELDGQTVEYYVLKPLSSDRSLIYVPVQNKTLTSRMRRILSCEEADRLIQDMPRQNVPWIDDDNQRKETYRQALSSGEPLRVVRVIQSLYRHRQELQVLGKKLRQSDERFFHEAETMLYGELALVWQMEPDQVPLTIMERIQTAQQHKTTTTA